MNRTPVSDCPNCGTPRDEDNTDCCDDTEKVDLRAENVRLTARADLLAVNSGRMESELIAARAEVESLKAQLAEAQKECLYLAKSLSAECAKREQLRAAREDAEADAREWEQLCAFRAKAESLLSRWLDFCECAPEQLDIFTETRDALSSAPKAEPPKCICPETPDGTEETRQCPGCDWAARE